MSWLYSQALVAAYSAGTSLDGAPCALWNGTPTQPPSWLPAKTTDACRLSRSGMMYKPLTDDHGGAVSMSFLAAFPVRTSAQPEKAQESTEHAAECGRTWPESFARWDRDTSSWRTPQCSLFADLDAYSETWPRWGMMRDGECWELSMPVPRTEENESGLWPTPNCPNGGRSVAHVTDWRGRTAYHNGKKVQVGLEAAVKLWPTPTVCGNYNRAGITPKAGDGLATAVRQWPTPTAQDAKNNGAPSQMERNTKPLNAEVGGPLNPTWVEWLMGWPIGWTDLEPLETDRFRQWQNSHGRF
jgi:hypothetical protein